MSQLLTASGGEMSFHCFIVNLISLMGTPTSQQYSFLIPLYAVRSNKFNIKNEIQRIGTSKNRKRKSSILLRL